MSVHRTRVLMFALAAIMLFVGATGGVAAASAPAPGAAVARAVLPGQEGREPAATDLGAAIDAEIAEATGNPAYARLRALVNRDRFPEVARATVARLLDEGLRRAAPAAHACRRLAEADGAPPHPDLAERCRPWLAAHTDGPLALAACRRMALTFDTGEGEPPIPAARCRPILAVHEHDEGMLRGICARLAPANAAGEVDALGRRCRVRPTVIEPGSAARLAACVQVARLAVDPADLIERCRALLAGADDHEQTRTLRVLPAVADAATRVGAETEEDGIHPDGTLQVPVPVRTRLQPPDARARVDTPPPVWLLDAAATATPVAR